MTKKFNFLIFTLSLLLLSAPYAEAGHKTLTVKVKNVSSMVLTPVVIATSHNKWDVKFFTFGNEASSELEELAESGNTAPLAFQFEENGANVVTGNAPLLPGEEQEFRIKKGEYISVASMLLPTNDAFFGINAKKIRPYKRKSVIHAKAYDAGTEVNDELCASIPGPQCGGAGTSVESGEGFIKIHPGTHGQADIDPAQYDWQNPIVKVTVIRH